MNRIQTVEDIKRLGTIVGIWAHPDDETFTSAGIMAAAVRNGQRVVCVTATRGEAGVKDESRWPADQLGSIRSRELQDALTVLGIKEHHWLGFGDGKCGEVDTKEAISKIIAVLQAVQPDTILTFGPEGLTGHPDHRAVSDWTSAAVSRSSHRAAIFHAVTLYDVYEKYLKTADKKLGIYYKIDEPLLKDHQECHICLELPLQLRQVKHNALKAQPSQYTQMFDDFTDDELDHFFSTEAFVRAE